MLGARKLLAVISVATEEGAKYGSTISYIQAHSHLNLISRFCAHNGQNSLAYKRQYCIIFLRKKMYFTELP